MVFAWLILYVGVFIKYKIRAQQQLIWEENTERFFRVIVNKYIKVNFVYEQKIIPTEGFLFVSSANNMIGSNFVIQKKRKRALISVLNHEGLKKVSDLKISFRAFYSQLRSGREYFYCISFSNLSTFFWRCCLSETKQNKVKEFVVGIILKHAK